MGLRARALIASPVDSSYHLGPALLDEKEGDRECRLTDR